MAKIITKIKKGTVIDHIKSGNAPKVVEALKLHKNRNVVYVGMHLKSKKMKRKDIVKIENVLLAPGTVTKKISRFAPKASVSWIKGSKVVKKVRLAKLKKKKKRKK